jgi:hypothetical protein
VIIDGEAVVPAEGEHWVRTLAAGRRVVGMIGATSPSKPLIQLCAEDAMIYAKAAPSIRRIRASGQRSLALAA